MEKNVKRVFFSDKTFEDLPCYELEDGTKLYPVYKGSHLGVSLSYVQEKDIPYGKTSKTKNK